MPPLRPSQISVFVEKAMAPVFQILIGAFFMVGGFLLVRTSLQSEPHNSKLFYWGFASAIGGALTVPGIFTAIKPVYILIFPNGLPWIGGKRSTDLPLPPSDDRPA